MTPRSDSSSSSSSSAALFVADVEGAGVCVTVAVEGVDGRGAAVGEAVGSGVGCRIISATSRRRRSKSAAKTVRPGGSGSSSLSLHAVVVTLNAPPDALLPPRPLPHGPVKVEPEDFFFEEVNSRSGNK